MILRILHQQGDGLREKKRELILRVWSAANYQNRTRPVRRISLNRQRRDEEAYAPPALVLILPCGEADPIESDSEAANAGHAGLLRVVAA